MLHGPIAMHHFVSTCAHTFNLCTVRFVDGQIYRCDDLHIACVRHVYMHSCISSLSQLSTQLIVQCTSLQL
jgi:hypothetical protein